MAVSEDDRRNKRFVAVDELGFPEHGVVQGWLNGRAKVVRLVRQVFTNKDSSTGTLHLACSDITCDYDAAPLELQETVASGGVSQEPEIKRRSGQFTDTDAAHTKQPHLHVDLRGFQARMFEHQDPAQPHTQRL